MGIETLSNIAKFFTGGDRMPDPEQKKKLVEEALLMTLSRATNADSNIGALEVETVQKIFLEVAGKEVSCKDIRVAAISDLYKEATLNKYLSNVRGKFDVADRQMIVRSLAYLIKVDGKVSPFEVEFFNGVVTAFGLTPAEVTGLDEDDIKI